MVLLSTIDTHRSAKALQVTIKIKFNYLILLSKILVWKKYMILLSTIHTHRSAKAIQVAIKIEFNYLNLHSKILIWKQNVVLLLNISELIGFCSSRNPLLI